MILVLLIILAGLIWAIQTETDRSEQESIQLVCECNGCHALVEPELLVCPHCHERLSESCPHCQQSKLVSQLHCPYCGERSKEVSDEAA